MNLRRIDDLCDDFEAALRQGESALIEDYLDQVDMQYRSKLLRELLEIEIELSAQKPVSDEASYSDLPVMRLQKSLKERFPEQGDLVDSVVRRVTKLRQIGDYEILEELGHGGMGIVYKARQKLLNQIVAIKVLSQTLLDDPQAVGRFRREMQLIGSLNHPNIVRALNAGTSNSGEGDGTHYLVMEFVDGITLQRLCDTLRKKNDASPEKKEGETTGEYRDGESHTAPTVIRLDASDMKSAVKKSISAASSAGASKAGASVVSIGAACEVIRQAALGLQHAHEFGLIHRDIKPANLMLDRYGTVKVLDLGLGKFLAERRLSDEEASLTMAGTTIGTIDYISPEQCENAGDADIRADIYSLGCTLYFLITGKAPYSGSRYDTTRKKLMAHIVGEIPKLNKAVTDVPDELEAILETMLAKEPGERFQTPQEVADAIAPLASFEELYHLAGGESGGVGGVRTVPGSTGRISGTSDTRQTLAIERPESEYAKGLRTLSKILVFVALMVLIVTAGTVLGLRYYFAGIAAGDAGRPPAVPPVSVAGKTPEDGDVLKTTVRTDLTLLPGLYGGWWFEETPWYLPFVREMLLREIDAADDVKTILGDTPEKYFDANIPSVRDWLWKIVRKHLETLPAEKRALVERLHDFYETNREDLDPEKTYRELLDLFLAGRPDQAAWSAADMHSRAVLEHWIAATCNDRELAVTAAEHYTLALDRYRQENRQADNDLAPADAGQNDAGLLELLCRSDAARLEYLATGSYRKAIEKFEDVRLQLRSVEGYRSLLFQAELQAAFGALCAEAGQYQDGVFTWGIDTLKRSRLGKGIHPLTAQLAERYAWSLIDQWKITEAENQFREALFIRAANQRESGCRFATVYIWHDWHAMAMTLRYLGNTEQAIEEYRKTLSSIDKELEICRAGVKDDSTVHEMRRYHAKVRDRAANTRERLADCTLYGGAASGVNQARLNEMARLYGEAAELYDIEGAARTMRAKQAIVLLLQNEIARAEQILCDLDEQKRHLLGNQLRTDMVRQVADALLACKKSGDNKADKTLLHQFLDQFTIPSNPVFADATRRETLELRVFCAEFLVAEAAEDGDMQSLGKDVALLVQPMGFFQNLPESRPFLRRVNDLIVRSYALLYESLPDESPVRQTYLRGIVRLLEWMRLKGPSEEAASSLVVFFLTDDPKDGFVVFYPLDVSRRGELFRLPLTRKEIKGGSKKQDSKWKLDPKLLELVENERKEGRRVVISWNDETCRPRSEDALSDADWPFEELRIGNE